MSADFKKLTKELRSLAARLVDRCQAAEARVAELEVEQARQQSRIEQLEKELAEMTTKYRSLQTGLALGQEAPEQIERMKAEYLAMVAEIDECISKLEKHNG